jgi:type IV pilus assembly protein PilA
MARKENGFSLIELLIVVAIILIIAAIAIPNLMRSRQSANEAAAVSTLRTLNTAESTYNTSFGHAVGYASTMVALGPTTTVCDQYHSCMIDGTLACSTQPCLRGGYNYFLVSDSGSAPFMDYAFTAAPLAWGSTGSKNFCTADDGVIRYQAGATAALTSAAPHDTCINFAQYNPI